MKMILFITMTFISVTIAQSVEVVKVTGIVKVISGTDNSWSELKQGMNLGPNHIISTANNSSVKLRVNDISFSLGESSAIAVQNIKRMTVDELLLALAMENILNAPRKKNGNKSNNTAVYGTDEGKSSNNEISSGEFGLKRLSGARQLANSGLKESAIITSREVFRKYPETRTDADSRIYFADLLFEKGLYEEAYEEYTAIKSLRLNADQSLHISGRSEDISKKLLNK